MAESESLPPDAEARMEMLERSLSREPLACGASESQAHDG